MGSWIPSELYTRLDSDAYFLLCNMNLIGHFSMQHGCYATTHKTTLTQLIGNLATGCTIADHKYKFTVPRAS